MDCHRGLSRVRGLRESFHQEIELALAWHSPKVEKRTALSSRARKMLSHRAGLPFAECSGITARFSSHSRWRYFRKSSTTFLACGSARIAFLYSAKLNSATAAGLVLRIFLGGFGLFAMEFFRTPSSPVSIEPTK